jgi:hypothetical protein
MCITVLYVVKQYQKLLQYPFVFPVHALSSTFLLQSFMCWSWFRKVRKNSLPPLINPPHVPQGSCEWSIGEEDGCVRVACLLAGVREPTRVCCSTSTSPTSPPAACLVLPTPRLLLVTGLICPEGRVMFPVWCWVLVHSYCRNVS